MRLSEASVGTRGRRGAVRRCSPRRRSARSRAARRSRRWRTSVRGSKAQDVRRPDDDRLRSFHCARHEAGAGRGHGQPGQGQRAHRIVQTVTSVTKEVAGAAWPRRVDRDFQDGELVESEISFWSQDDAGNVWNLGEYPEEWEDGVLIGAPSTWLNGTAAGTGGRPHAGRSPAGRGLLPPGSGASRRVPGSGSGQGGRPADVCRPVATTGCSSQTSGRRSAARGRPPAEVRARPVSVSCAWRRSGAKNRRRWFSPSTSSCHGAELDEAIAKVLHLDQRAYVLAKSVSAWNRAGAGRSREGRPPGARSWRRTRD